MPALLQAVNIEKKRGQRLVLTGIDLEVSPGEVVGVLGPNGAGKSTLMALLAGLVAPDAGAVRLDGTDLRRLGARAYTRLGVALQRPGFSPRLTVRDILRFFALCYARPRPLAELLHRFDLAAKQHCQIRHLSLGEKQRLSLAVACMSLFDVLLLDEPTAGLDMKGREAVWQEIQQARQRGAAVVWVTHAMDEAQQWSDRLLLLHAGQQLALETPQALRQSLQGGEKIELTGTCTLAADTLACLPGVTRVLRQGATLTLYCQKANDILRVVLAQETLPHIFCGLVSLEDVLRLRIEERTGPCKS